MCQGMPLPCNRGGQGKENREGDRGCMRRLRHLWLRRSRPSNFEITKRRIDRSVRSLRRGARALARSRPPPPPPPHPGFSLETVLAALQRTGD